MASASTAPAPASSKRCCTVVLLRLSRGPKGAAVVVRVTDVLLRLRPLLLGSSCWRVRLASRVRVGTGAEEMEERGCCCT
jgi:hypothetical protein